MVLQETKWGASLLGGCEALPTLLVLGLEVPVDGVGVVVGALGGVSGDVVLVGLFRDPWLLRKTSSWCFQRSELASWRFRLWLGSWKFLLVNR